MSDGDLPPNPDFDGDTADADSQTTGLYINLAIGIPITIICAFLFDLLRAKIPSVFEARRKLNLDGDPVDYMGNRVATPPPPSYRLFGWVMPTLRLDLDTIADTHGLDTALFLRYLEFMFFLFLYVSISTIVLIPLYYTGPLRNLPKTNPSQTRGLNKASIGNISRDDPWRFWIVLAVEYTITIFVCYHIRRQFNLYSVYRRRYRSTSHPANYAIIVQDIPYEHRSEQAVYEYWDYVFPGEVAAVFFVQDARRLEKEKARFWDAVDKRERAEYDQYTKEQKKLRKRKKKGKPTEGHLAESPYHNSEQDSVDASGSCFGLCAPGDATRATAYWREQQNRYYARVAAHQIRKEEGTYPLTQSAIVVFNSRRAASVAAQTNFARTEDEWRVSRAPEPEAINWGALCVTGWTVYIRKFITTVLGTVFTVFWVIPITALMGVASLSSLAKVEFGGEKPFAFLSNIATLSPVMTGFLESYLPTVVLTIFLAYVPKLFELFVSISRIISRARRDGLVRDWYFLFVTVSNFLFVVFAGTLLKEVERIIEKPTDAVEILARNIPKQAAFMMNFIILTALTETPRELLQLVRILIRWIKLKFFAKTERQRSEADVGDMEMDFGGNYAMGQLVTLLGLVYCTIQPLIVFCCMAYFGINFIVFKYNVCYAFHNEYQDGGRMFGGAIYSVWVGLFVHLVTMVGVLGLNKSLAQSVLIIIPAVAAVLFVWHCKKSYSRVLEHGSALETQDRLEDLEGTGGVDSISRERAELYLHPGFEGLPSPDKLENLNGVAKGSSDEGGSLKGSDMGGSSGGVSDSAHARGIAENVEAVHEDESAVHVEVEASVMADESGRRKDVESERDEFESTLNEEIPISYGNANKVKTDAM